VLPGPAEIRLERVRVELFMDKLKMHSPDLTPEKIRQIAELLPNCVTESRGEDGAARQAIDFDQLRQELSDHIVEGPAERYRLDWPGKREAILTANRPIAKTLRPCLKESVDFDITKNLFIEGDNLDALKLLQETYLGKVKLIYIDPPYNTGNDFLYEDDFSQDIRTHLLRSNQDDELGRHLVTNTEANGRFHSDWLSMMYPRLKLARNMLSAQGLICISIDDNEVTNLRRVCDEVFGEEAFLMQFVWRRRSMADSRNEDKASNDHEYVVCYKMPEAKLRGNRIDITKYTNPDNDPRGAWLSTNLTGIANKEERPNLHYDLVNPATGIAYPPSPTRGWCYSRSTMNDAINEDRIIWPPKPEGRPRLKKFLKEITRHETGFSSWLSEVGQTSEGTKSLQELFGEKVFPFSKPGSLVRTLIEQMTSAGDLVLDFFAGSATTAHAVFEQNVKDGESRRFILVQIPALTGRKDYETIADLSMERIRRAGAKVAADAGLLSVDTGFRVLKIDSSNMQDVYYTPDDTKQATLLDHVDSVKPDRTPEDLLFQVLLDWGVDLASPIASETVDGKQVFFVDGNALWSARSSVPLEELV
jgi:adenine-specific DNA-methyltransferase